MQITSGKIAELCNVSRATVDRALKGKPGIKEETRQKILAVAAQNNYVVNTVASSLSTGKTHSVGVIVFNLLNQHFSSMVNAIEQKLAEYDLITCICLSEYSKAREQEIVECLIARKVDGLIMLPIHYERDFYEFLKGTSIPTVIVSNRLYDLPFVGGDGKNAVYQAMYHYVMNGYDTVHFVCPPLRWRSHENIYAQADRAQGYQLFMQNNPGMHGELIGTADYLEKLYNLIKNADKKPGVFCSSDQYMLRIIRMLAENGWDVNEKCALMGFDGSEILSYLPKRPSSILYPSEKIGEAAAEMLHSLLAGHPVQPQILLPCPLLPGNATFETHATL